MLFDSYEFALFFLCALGIYSCLRWKGQNRFLLIASYVFYGWWDYRFLTLILLSTMLDFFCGLALEKASGNEKKKYLFASLFGNLSILCFFKYYDFFVENLIQIFQAVGLQSNLYFIEIAVPVGVSFYTFQTLSYTIDVYRGDVRASRSFFDFALYVAFFPQLVAGPIERGSRLLPQINNPRRMTLDGFKEGGWLIAWGLYKKVFIADNLGYYVDQVYGNPSEHGILYLLIGTYAFAIQIYADFSGYTDIARGVARILGFNLMLNFNLPYFSLNPQQFWRRWHISLSQWLRDYLYIPLGGSAGTQSRVFRNLTITMLLGGLWHGAAWNFVLWGAYHGMLLVAYRGLFGKQAFESTGIMAKLIAGFIFFNLTCLGWFFFRINEMSDLGMFISSGFRHDGALEMFLAILGYSIILLIVQVLQAQKSDLMAPLKLPVLARVVLYLVIYFSISLGGVFDDKPFIYFQF